MSSWLTRARNYIPSFRRKTTSQPQYATVTRSYEIKPEPPKETSYFTRKLSNLKSYFSRGKEDHSHRKEELAKQISNFNDLIRNNYHEAAKALKDIQLYDADMRSEATNRLHLNKDEFMHLLNIYDQYLDALSSRESVLRMLFQKFNSLLKTPGIHEKRLHELKTKYAQEKDQHLSRYPIPSHPEKTLKYYADKKKETSPLKHSHVHAASRQDEESQFETPHHSSQKRSPNRHSLFEDERSSSYGF
jgi:hypothetical protein